MQTRIALCALAALATMGCPRSNPKPEPASTSSAQASQVAPPSTPAASAAASEAPVASAPPIGPPPICKVQSQKIWTSGTNKLAGLTEDELNDGRVAIGLAIGQQPAVLIVGRGGEGRLVKVPVKAGTVLGTALKAGEGVRSILRVTPVHLDGDTVHAFVDFRDELKDKRRRVACGPADSDEWWVAFDDIPFLSRRDQNTDQVNAAFKKTASGSAEYHEIRDCRTFADIDRKETYILGSGLDGTMQPDATITWKSTLFIDLGAKSHEKHLHSIELKGEPVKVQDYEVPVSRRLDDGSFLIAVRNNSRLLVGLLNPDKTLRGDLTGYAGFPTLPDIASDGEDVIVTTSLAKGKGEYGLRALRIHQQNPALPRYYSTIVTDTAGVGSETDPDFTRDSRGRRWLAHIEGERGKGKLSIAPIDSAFHHLGRPFQVTADEEKASSARLVAMGDGGILVIYIRENGELVTEEVHCTIAD
jgi:hypothetical protein